MSMDEQIRAEFGGARLILVDQTLSRTGGHYLTYNHSLAEAAKELGLDPVILASNMLAPDLLDMPGVVPAFSGSWHTPHNPVEPFAPCSAALPTCDTFASELMLALRRIRANPHDHVFIHTVGFYEVGEIQRALLQERLEDLPCFHILCRRDLDEAPIGSERRVSFEYAVKSLAVLARHGLDVRFYTDTPELSHHYTAETGVEFVTLPLPFGIDVLEAAMAEHAGERMGRSLTRFCYLGDAREEKGYQHLPQAIDGLPSDLKFGALQFVLQSNYNSPKGEPLVVRARGQLQQMPRRLVDLRMKPLNDPDYFAVLASSDAALIPYDVANYARRSSGVFTEALYAGALPIVPAGTSMANQLPKDFPTIYESVSHLSEIFALVHERKPELQAAIEKISTGWRRLHSPKNLIIQLLSTPCAQLVSKVDRVSAFAYRENPPSLPKSRPLSSAKPLVAVHVIDLESMYWRIGAGYVMRLQASAMVQIGASTFALMIVHKQLDERHEDRRLRPSYWVRQAEEVARELGYSGFWIVYEGRPANTEEVGLAAKFAAAAEIVPSDGFLRFLGNVQPDIIYTNYAQNFPVLQRCGLSGIPFVLESHDIQSHHNALYQEDIDADEEFATELSVYRRASAVSCLTEPDAQHLLEAGVRNVEHCLPLIDPTPPNSGVFAGVQDLAELLSASGAREPTVDISAAGRTGQLDQVRRLVNERRMNLLFVGGWHKPNIQGMDWFFEEVFKPHLEPANVNLFVVGGIFPEKARYPSDRIFWAGLLDRLDLVYAGAEIVIAPLLAGTGVNIKVLEALAIGKPVVGTSVAFRGIHGARETLGCFDDPEAFADRVLQLINRSHEREQAAQASRELYARLIQENNYALHVKALFGRAGLMADGQGRAVSVLTPNVTRLMPATRRVEPPLDWRGADPAIARYVRSVTDPWAETGQLEFSVREIENRANAAGVAAALHEIYVGQTAIALDNPDMARRLALPGPKPSDWREAWRRIELMAIERTAKPGALDIERASAGARTIGDVILSGGINASAARAAHPSQLHLFHPSSRSGVDMGLLANGFDLLIWAGRPGLGQPFVHWLMSDVIESNPVLRDASILLVGGQPPRNYKGGATVCIDEAANIDGLVAISRCAVFPTSEAMAVRPDWLRAALVFSALGKFVVAPGLGALGSRGKLLSLGQNEAVWRDALADIVSRGGAASPVPVEGVVPLEELEAHAPQFLKELKRLSEIDFDWSPANSALGAALHVLERGATLNRRQERELRARAGDERFERLAALQIQTWLDERLAIDVRHPAWRFVADLVADPSIAALLRTVRTIARNEVQPNRLIPFDNQDI
jgi:glycosyltransferase involved in cell wall biosynthesis